MKVKRIRRAAENAKVNKTQTIPYKHGTMAKFPGGETFEYRKGGNSRKIAFGKTDGTY